MASKDRIRGTVIGAGLLLLTIGVVWVAREWGGLGSRDVSGSRARLREVLPGVAVRHAIAVAKKEAAKLAQRPDSPLALVRNAQLAAESWLGNPRLEQPILMQVGFAVIDPQDSPSLAVFAVDNRRSLDVVKIAARSGGGKILEIRVRDPLSEAGYRQLGPLYIALIPVRFVAFDEAAEGASWDEHQGLLIVNRSSGEGEERLAIPDPSACEIAVGVEDCDGRSSNYLSAGWLKYSRPAEGRSSTQPTG